MKTIIVPTDFSETANNAVLYAAELAASIKAKLLLVHAYHVPVQVNEVPFVTITEVELKRDNEKALKKLEKKITSKVKGSNIETIAESGFAADVIQNITSERNVDLIIMGISGAGAVGEALLGSVAVDTVRNGEVPVIIVPADAKFVKPGKIVFAYDYADVKDKSTIAAIIQLVKLFGSRLMIVNVINESESATFKKAVAGLRMEGMLEGVEHTLHFPVNNSVIDGINDFVRDTDAGMVAMIAHKHNVFYRLFNLSSTKKMAFHTKVPLLAIPEKISGIRKPGRAKKKLAAR